MNKVDREGEKNLYTCFGQFSSSSSSSDWMRDNMRRLKSHDLWRQIIWIQTGRVLSIWLPLTFDSLSTVCLIPSGWSPSCGHSVSLQDKRQGRITAVHRLDHRGGSSCFSYCCSSQRVQQGAASDQRLWSGTGCQGPPGRNHDQLPAIGRLWGAWPY